MIQVIPAILTADEREFTEKLRLLETFAKYIQVDFCDGQFVESVTVTPEVVRNAKPAVPIEAQLMVKDPSDWIGRVATIPASRIIIHIEALTDPGASIAEMKVYGKEIGLALNPSTPIDRIAPYLEDIDAVLFMTVVPGKQGNSFLPQVLPMIRMLRDQNDEIVIEADGGISSKNILQLAEAGVDNVIVGSGILADSELSPEDAYSQLITMLTQYQTHTR